jgi:hypothetical protein
VDMSGVDTGGLVEMQSNSLIRRLSPLNLELPGFGYRLYRLQPTVRLP